MIAIGILTAIVVCALAAMRCYYRLGHCDGYDAGFKDGRAVAETLAATHYALLVGKINAAFGILDVMQIVKATKSGSTDKVGAILAAADEKISKIHGDAHARQAEFSPVQR
jgi:hypothetical protein